MEVNSDDWTTPHSIPNAWMASTPHHPLWLFPLSNVLTRLGADGYGKLPTEGTGWWKDLVEELPGVREGVESITGPVALLDAVKSYRKWMGHEHSTRNLNGGEIDIAERTDSAKRDNNNNNPFSPSLQKYANIAPKSHEVIVFDSAIIYPFSWAAENGNRKGEVYKKCRAAPKIGGFDPIRCQGMLSIDLIQR